MNSCMYARMYVYLCICLLVCMLANDFINVKTPTCIFRISCLTGKLDFYGGYKFYRGSCLICLIRSYGTVFKLSQCYHSSEKHYVPPLEFDGGGKSFLFSDLGGLASLPSM